MSDLVIGFDPNYERNAENMKILCLHLCKKYVPGKWIYLSEKEFIFQSVCGGFENQIYYCSTPISMGTCDKGVKDVIIKFYGKFNSKSVEQKTHNALSDLINSLILSLNGLSPKVYGVFSGGQIQEYFKSRWFDIEEQKDPELVSKVAQTLAKIHCIKAPISKYSKPLYKRLEEIYKNRSEKYAINDLIARSQCKELLNTDLEAEIHWIKSVVLLADSPVVFSHKDYWGTNILIDDNNNIKVCDLEYCSYGSRARDFAALFTLWNRKLMDFSDPESHELVADSVMEFFFEKYRVKFIEICGEKYGNDEKNSINKLIFETKLYILVMRFFYFLITIHLDENAIKTHSKDQIESKHFNITAYFKLKKQLIEEKLISK